MFFFQFCSTHNQPEIETNKSITTSLPRGHFLIPENTTFHFIQFWVFNNRQIGFESSMTTIREREKKYERMGGLFLEGQKKVNKNKQL